MFWITIIIMILLARLNYDAIIYAIIRPPATQMNPTKLFNKPRHLNYTGKGAGWIS